MANKKFQSTIQTKFTLSKFQQNCESYYRNMTGGKFVLTPNELDEALIDGNDFPEFSIAHLGT